MGPVQVGVSLPLLSDIQTIWSICPSHSSETHPYPGSLPWVLLAAPTTPGLLAYYFSAPRGPLITHPSHRMPRGSLPYCWAETLQLRCTSFLFSFLGAFFYLLLGPEELLFILTKAQSPLYTLPGSLVNTKVWDTSSPLVTFHHSPSKMTPNPTFYPYHLQ